MKEHEHVQRLTVWLKPELIHRMDSHLVGDNCKNRSELISKALRFYMGYLTVEDTSEYLSRALADTLKGTVEINTMRLSSLLFKLSVEVNLLGHLVAGGVRLDQHTLQQLRDCAEDEVRRTNGKLYLEHAADARQYNKTEW